MTSAGPVTAALPLRFGVGPRGSDLPGYLVLDPSRRPGTTDGGTMADTVLEELLVSTEVQTARDRLDDYDNAELAANQNPHGEQELAGLRDALVEMPGAVRMLLTAIDRAGADSGEPQYGQQPQEQ